MPLIEFGILLALIVLNGLLAMSELAIVSSRRSKLKALVDEGRTGAGRALALASDPGRFLSTVQIGITLVGILAGAFSGATLGARLGNWLATFGLPFVWAETIGYGAVIVAITYLSLVVGELVPKQLALRNPERLALLVAPAMTWLSRVAAPFVWLLDVSGRFVLRLFGTRGAAESEVTAEEIKALIAEAETSGAIEPEERKMIAGVLRLGDRSARAIMTPRNDVELIDASAPLEEIKAAFRKSVHGRFPAHLGNPEDIAGVLHSKDLLNASLEGGPIDVRALIRQAPVIPDTADVLKVVQVLHDSPVHMGLVHDEYGQFQGIITNMDILDSITGVASSDTGEAEPMVVERADGSWLVSGELPVDELTELLGIKARPDVSAHTAAGYVIGALKHLPSVGECIDIGAWRFEIVDMDGRRIDKLLVQRVREPRRVKRG